MLGMNECSTVFLLSLDGFCNYICITRINRHLRLFTIFYIRVRHPSALLCSRVLHPSSFSMDITLAKG